MTDERFPFRDDNGRWGRCHVRLVQPEAGAPVVIVSELAENEAMSVCNCFEELAPQIAFRFDLDGAHLRYVEHWGPHSYADRDRDEEFTTVAFTFDPKGRDAYGLGVGRFSNPHWRIASRAGVEAICDAPLPPFPFETSAPRS